MSALRVMYDKNALREFVAAILRESNENAVVILRKLQGAMLKDAATALAEIGNGGEFASEAVRLADIRAAHDFARGILDKLKPFADIIREVLPRGVWVRGRYKNKCGHYELVGIAEGRREAREERVARMPLSYEDAAGFLRIEHDKVRHYVRSGHLKAITVGGSKFVTRESAVIFRKWLKGFRFSATGEEFKPSEYVTPKEARSILGRGVTRMAELANDGRLVCVYSRPTDFKACCGYTRASVEAVKRDLEAVVFFTATGKVYLTERVSLDEAQKIIGRRRHFVTALGDAGILERVYNDPKLRHPYGYTRASVIAYLQANPRHIPARAAVAVAEFKIEELPPLTRRHHFRAAVLDPADGCAKVGGAAAEVFAKTRKRQGIIFRLSNFTETEKETSMQGNENTSADETASNNGDKLKVAKAFTIHEGGVIRAICVSEGDRDEITAALEFYRKFKGRESEIESAVALLRVTKKALHIDEGGAAEVQA